MNGGINISLVSKDAEVDKLLEMIYISQSRKHCVISINYDSASQRIFSRII